MRRGISRMHSGGISRDRSWRSSERGWRRGEIRNAKQTLKIYRRKRRTRGGRKRGGRRLNGLNKLNGLNEEKSEGWRERCEGGGGWTQTGGKWAFIRESLCDSLSRQEPMPHDIIDNRESYLADAVRPL